MWDRLVSISYHDAMRVELPSRQSGILFRTESRSMLNGVRPTAGATGKQQCVRQGVDMVTALVHSVGGLLLGPDDDIAIGGRASVLTAEDGRNLTHSRLVVAATKNTSSWKMFADRSEGTDVNKQIWTRTWLSTFSYKSDPGRIELEETGDSDQRLEVYIEPKIISPDTVPPGSARASDDMPQRKVKCLRAWSVTPA